MLQKLAVVTGNIYIFEITGNIFIMIIIITSNYVLCAHKILMPFVKARFELFNFLNVFNLLICFLKVICLIC